MKDKEEPLKVDKAASDDVLRKVAHSGLVKKSDAKTDKTKPAKIISPQKQNSVPTLVAYLPRVA